MKVIFDPSQLVPMPDQIFHLKTETTLTGSFELTDDLQPYCSGCTSTKGQKVVFRVEKLTDSDGIDLDPEQDKKKIESICTQLEKTTTHMLTYCSNCYDTNKFFKQVDQLEEFTSI